MGASGLVNEEGVKRCVRCGECRPRAAFARRRSNLDGLQRHCRECASDYHRARQESLGKKVRPKVEVPEGHKLCLKCGEVKPWSAWHRNATASDGLSTRCKACRAVEGRAGHLKRHYGLTEAERDEMVASQMGICVICLKAPAAHVDHCHRTGSVRGVLCFNCNSAIGKLGDDPDAVRRAAAYLEGTPWKPTLVAPGVYRLPS
ncbi:endonuclease VII domain-containing protein [Streptomyces avermitilis]|uniref:Endonuclease VII n=2 Tax=Streptomyces avermitilis TaxID=33903 RepID=Q828I9_STRAW|nr:recombination endonuclease VII [Streptomyces avermitilis]BAC74391.1 putative endonuclease VII [Streptomyces avermitilis MA-4680 = NBRC 14893]BBJ54953.1 recombination endonuclease VII [Streptomyces avermitilis]GDY66940.1 recombination endonuclease VII [Streptomyces avermitilis]GDY72802.1 recombination endonuclease VII [Streptomyces avermitilis]